MFRKFLGKFTPLISKSDVRYTKNVWSNKFSTQKFDLPMAPFQRMYVTMATKRIAPNLLDKEFLELFPQVINDLTKNYCGNWSNKATKVADQWFRSLLEYNAGLGKRCRPLMITSSYYLCCPNPTEEGIRLSYLLGWCIELLEGYIVLVDDLLDNAKMRRGKLCWHQIDGVGSIAINDCFFMYSSAFVILKKYFENLSCYVPLFELIQDTHHKTIYGQGIDMLILKDKDYESLSKDLYNTLAVYKTAYCTFHVALKAGMLLAGLPQNLIENEHLNDILSDLGILYQTQNDFYDCFDIGVNKKPGTDIQEGKCTWNFISAKEKCSPEQKSLLIRNYGHNNPSKIKTVTDIYKQVEIPKEFEKFVDKTLGIIFQKIDRLPKEIPREMFKYVIKGAEYKAGYLMPKLPPFLC